MQKLIARYIQETNYPGLMIIGDVNQEIMNLLRQIPGCCTYYPNIDGTLGGASFLDYSEDKAKERMNQVRGVFIKAGLEAQIEYRGKQALPKNILESVATKLKFYGSVKETMEKEARGLISQEDLVEFDYNELMARLG